VHNHVVDLEKVQMHHHKGLSGVEKQEVKITEKLYPPKKLYIKVKKK